MDYTNLYPKLEKVLSIHVFEHDYDEIEAKIYMERKEYDKLILFCKRQNYRMQENLKKYGKRMPLEDQKEIAGILAESIKKRLEDVQKSKDYAWHVVSIQEMINSCKGGRTVALELVEYLLEQYRSRPALMSMLRQLKI